MGIIVRIVLTELEAMSVMEAMAYRLSEEFEDKEYLKKYLEMAYEKTRMGLVESRNKMLLKSSNNTP